MARSRINPGKASGAKSARSVASRSKASPPKASSAGTGTKKTTKSASAPKKAVAKKAPAKRKTGRSTRVTKAVKSSKRNSSAKAGQVAASSPPEDDGQHVPAKPVPKTRLNDAQLAEFRKMLLDKRRELVGDVDHLTREALRRSRSEAAGDLSSMPIHMADIGTDNWEQEFTLGLIDTERTLLHEIDEALGRIDNRTYGVCLATHKPITLARLRAKPWAKYCIRHARLLEQGRAS
ncbi:MAG: TraR/DksA family transcriptional regulator [Phycisphaerae bacterium]